MAQIGAHDWTASLATLAAHRSARADAGVVCGKFRSAFSGGAIPRSIGRRETRGPGDKAWTQI